MKLSRKMEIISIKKTILLSILMLTSGFFSCSQGCAATTEPGSRKDTVEEKIWASEEAYFSNLYKANYGEVIVLVHDQFIGWPGALPQPIGREESAGFMRKLVPKPTSCKIRIERAGIRVLGTIALTQYTLYVNCKDSAGIIKSQSSRITHTWVKEGGNWKLLGGMSYDK
jgi:ketosteroid isomerase-like protein